MKYRNKKTGSVIEIRSRLSGKDWVEIKETSSAKARKRKTKEAAK